MTFMKPYHPLTDNHSQVSITTCLYFSVIYAIMYVCYPRLNFSDYVPLLIEGFSYSCLFFLSIQTAKENRDIRYIGSSLDL